LPGPGRWPLPGTADLRGRHLAAAAVAGSFGLGALAVRLPGVSRVV
jgi:hypothetical protein